MVGRHAVVLEGLRELASQHRPVILQRDDDDFLAAVLEELKSESGRAVLAQTRATTRERSVLKLFQPIQKQFHVVLFEVHCDQPGTPRLDPARIESAGFVLRREHVVARGERLKQGEASRRHESTREGWMQSDGRLRGWVPFANPIAELADPDPARRPPALSAGHPEINRQLAALAPAPLLTERVTPLFVAPPDVCRAAGRTILYGVVPVASAELAEGPVAPPAFDSDEPAEGEKSSPRELIREHLVGPLRGEAMTFPRAGQLLKVAWLNGSDAETQDLQAFLAALRQLGIELDAFGDSESARKLMDELNNIDLPLVRREGERVARTTPAGDFLRDAFRVLIENESDLSVEVPERWPALAAARQSKIFDAVTGALAKRFAAVKSKRGRFDATGRRYVLRAFVRVKPSENCPPRIGWSVESEPFTIAPWYEGAGAAPVQVALPDVTDRNLLKKLKPNVTFAVPPALQNLLSSNAKDLMEGKRAPDSGLKLGWLCSFNIPIITICAFIVLNIFLQILNLLFFWLPYVKICIPYPKGGGGNE